MSAALTVLLMWLWLAGSETRLPLPRLKTQLPLLGILLICCWCFPCVFAGQAFRSAPEKITEGAHEASFSLYYQFGSAGVIYRKRRWNE